MVDADGSQAGNRDRPQDLGDHVAARRDGDHVDLAVAALVHGVPDHLPVEDGLVEGHGDVVLCLEADRRLELVAIVDGGKAHGPDGDALVRDPDPHVARKALPREELLDRLAQCFGVCDLALAEDARGQRQDAASDDFGRAVDPNFGRGDAAGLDIEADDGLCLIRRDQ